MSGQVKGEGRGFAVEPFTGPPTPEALAEYIQRQFQRIETALGLGVVREVEFLNVAPPKVYEGLVRGADGTNWNPGGGGKGVYGYWSGAWNKLGGSSYTDEQAQDAVGTILVDSATVDFTYNDGTPSITASVITTGLTLFDSANRGVVPGSGGGTTNFLRADGSWASPGAAPAAWTFAAGSLTVATGTAQQGIETLQLTGSQRLTVAGTGRFRLSN